MRLTRRVLTILLILLLTLCPAAAAQAPPPCIGDATVMFTHDMHSRLLPATDETGTEYGGYARLKTAIDAVRKENPDAVLVDGGDFSMGSLFQTAYAETASELRVMGALGYDAVTLGNHEYDYRAAGLASMLSAAADSGEPLPAIVEANYLPPAPDEPGYNADAQAVWEAFERLNVSDYILFERGGIWYAVIGIMGVDSDRCAPKSGMILHDRFEKTRQAVDAARAECMEKNGVQPLVICLSHSGTGAGGEGEDYELAKKVKGIHLIVSAHTHTTLSEPIEVGGTWIVSAGEYAKNLGVATLRLYHGGEADLIDYRLIPIDGSLPDDPDIAALVESYKKEVDENYLSRFGLSFDQVLACNPYSFESVDEVYASRHESTLGNLLSDAYKWAAERSTGERVDLALTASGVIRESFAAGDITVSDVFNAASLGIGADGVPGYPLIAVYLTGADLKNAFEVDASVSEIMKAARLYFSGAAVEYNTNRMFLNKTVDAVLLREDGTREEIDDGRLYRVVTGLYCGQMLSAAEGASYGLLSVTARDADGKPIDMDRLEEYIVRGADGNEVKEWYAIASYLQSMGGEVDAKYAAPDGRKTVAASLSPVKLLKNANKFTVLALALIVLLPALAALAVRALVRRVKRRGKNK